MVRRIKNNLQIISSLRRFDPPGGAFECKRFDKNGKLIGIISPKDVLKASYIRPSIGWGKSKRIDPEVKRLEVARQNLKNLKVKMFRLYKRLTRASRKIDKEILKNLRADLRKAKQLESEKLKDEKYKIKLLKADALKAKKIQIKKRTVERQKKRLLEYEILAEKRKLRADKLKIERGEALLPQEIFPKEIIASKKMSEIFKNEMELSGENLLKRRKFRKPGKRLKRQHPRK